MKLVSKRVTVWWCGETVRKRIKTEWVWDKLPDNMSDKERILVVRVQSIDQVLDRDIRI